MLLCQTSSLDRKQVLKHPVVRTPIVGAEYLLVLSS